MRGAALKQQVSFQPQPSTKFEQFPTKSMAFGIEDALENRAITFVTVKLSFFDRPDGGRLPYQRSRCQRLFCRELPQFAVVFADDDERKH